MILELITPAYICHQVSFYFKENLQKYIYIYIYYIKNIETFLLEFVFEKSLVIS